MRSQESCREWVEGKVNYCFEDAVGIFWGKLFPPEALGPRCEQHADKWCLSIGRVTFAEAIRASWAIFDLRGGALR